MATRAQAPSSIGRAARAATRRRPVAASRHVPPVALVWAVFALVGAATVVTYWRLPAGQTWRFNDSGLSGGLSRMVTYLAFPVAIAAIGVVWAVCSRRVALVVSALCAVSFLPGVVDTHDFTAAWVDVPPVLGVALAVYASLRARDRAAVPLSRTRLVLLTLLGVLSVPWLIAAVGLYAEDLPGLGSVLMSRDPTPGNIKLASVHLGLHDGLMGAQLAAAALILSARRLSRGLSLYLSLMFVYGMALALPDAWSEQVVKRGWSGTELPGVMQPAVSLAWLAVLLAALAVHWAWFGREPRRRAVR